MRIEPIIDVKPLLGESPLWDVDGERLYFVDSLGCRVFRCTGDGGVVRAWTVPEPIGSLALRRGGAVVALKTGFHALDLATGGTELIGDLEADGPGTRLNDGKADPVGSLWRLDPDGSITRLDMEIVCSNGPCWSPDGRTLYFSGTVSAYNYSAAGEVSNKRVFATVDEEGFVWSATVFDGRVFRYVPDGTVDRVIEMLVVRITSLAFGGPGLGQLSVTSMAEPPLPKHLGDGPLRGAVFRILGLGVRGRPEPRFAG